jgi:hypothetical protein
MTKQPRKLPVITAIIYTDDTGKQSVLGAAVDEPEVSGIARASSVPIASGDAVLSLYIPDIPRCRTCDFYKEHMNLPGLMICVRHITAEHDVSVDGYCDQHSELTRAT